jgi:hypothetical protein
LPSLIANSLQGDILILVMADCVADQIPNLGNLVITAFGVPFHVPELSISFDWCPVPFC